MPINFQNRFNEYLHKKYPTTKQLKLFISESLVSPFVPEFSKDLVTQAQRVASATFALRSNTKYQQHVANIEGDPLLSFDPGNFSLFMSYDFHIQNSELKLIEINTNAAFSLVAHEIYLFQNVQNDNPLQLNFLKELKASFENETKLSIRQPHPNSMAIVDDSPAQQKMFIEFAMFQDLFNSWGWPCSIHDIKDLSHDGTGIQTPDKKPLDFVYNRSTNFFLNDLPGLRKAYVEKKICLSPNPHEYVLLADKARFLELADPAFLASCGLSDEHIKTLKTHVPFAKNMKDHSPDEIWNLRKNVFFKPKRAYGGKEVYKGANITRKVFEQILAGDFIAQEGIPAPHMNMKLPGGEEQDFKFDLRFYAYRDQIQLATARFYQGQLTNFRAPGSGFTAVRFI
jgi:hypothetical protein